MKLKPGYMYDSRGRPVKIDKRARKANELAAIRVSYAAKKRKQLDPYPKVRMVLDMAVKLTPRRRELLLAVVLDLIEWRFMPVHGYGGRSVGYGWLPFYGGQAIATTLTTLSRLRLVRWRRSERRDTKSEVNITLRGMTAAWEAADYENTPEKRERGLGAGRRGGYPD